MCGDQADITLYDSNETLIVSNNVELSEVRSIDVNGDCRGIDSLADRIVVSYVNPRKIEVLDYYGEVLQYVSYVWNPGKVQPAIHMSKTGMCLRN